MEITPADTVVYLHTLSKRITPNSLKKLCKSENTADTPTSWNIKRWMQFALIMIHNKPDLLKYEKNDNDFF